MPEGHQEGKNYKTMGFPDLKAFAISLIETIGDWVEIVPPVVVKNENITDFLDTEKVVGEEKNIYLHDQRLWKQGEFSSLIIALLPQYIKAMELAEADSHSDDGKSNDHSDYVDDGSL